MVFFFHYLSISIIFHFYLNRDKFLVIQPRNRPLYPRESSLMRIPLYTRRYRVTPGIMAVRSKRILVVLLYYSVVFRLPRRITYLLFFFLFTLLVDVAYKMGLNGYFETSSGGLTRRQPPTEDNNLPPAASDPALRPHSRVL